MKLQEKKIISLQNLTTCCLQPSLSPLYYLSSGVATLLFVSCPPSDRPHLACHRAATAWPSQVVLQLGNIHLLIELPPLLGQVSFSGGSLKINCPSQRKNLEMVRVRRKTHGFPQKRCHEAYISQFRYCTSNVQVFGTFFNPWRFQCKFWKDTPKCKTKNLLKSSGFQMFLQFFPKKVLDFSCPSSSYVTLTPPISTNNQPDTLVPSILGPWQAATSASSSSRGTLGLMSEVPGKNLGQLDHPKITGKMAQDR